MRLNPTRVGVALGALALAFAGRVFGQLLVSWCAPAWLPPMDDWYSGLLPYPILLPVQFAILALQAATVGQVLADGGALSRPRPRLGRFLCVFAAIYASAMAVRYGVTMTLYPERRWLGRGTIPIAFHGVLALYLAIWGRWLARPDRR